MKRSLTVAAAVAIAFAFAPGCGGVADGSDAGGVRDAGVLDSLIGRPDASIPDATLDRTSPWDAPPREDAPVNDDAAPLPDGPVFDGSLEPRVCDFMDAGPGAPPPYCVAPCLWQAISQCMPVLDACLLDEPHAGLAATSCDPQSGWSVREGYMMNGFSVLEVRHNGRLCYGIGYGVRPITYAQYSGPDGPIAVSFGVPGSGSPVICTKGTVSDFADMVPPPDAVSCKLERDRPECAAWNDFGYPVGTSCASETPGSCGDGGP